MTEATLNVNNYIDICWIPSKFHMCMYEIMKNICAQNQSSIHCPRVWKAVHNRTFWIILVQNTNITITFTRFTLFQLRRNTFCPPLSTRFTLFQLLRGNTFCPLPFAKAGTLKLIRPSVCPSVCHKNFNLAHIFWSINDRALIFGRHDPCDKSFLLVPCGYLDLDLLPTSRSNLFLGGGPQFSEFACYI